MKPFDEIPSGSNLRTIVSNRFRAVANGQSHPMPRVAARLTPIAVGDAIMSSVPTLSLSQIYPPSCGGINLNTCHDPDCGNFGVGAEFALRRARRDRSSTAISSLLSNSAAVGLGAYKLNSNTGKEHRRTSTVFEYEDDPHTWMDRKSMQCRHRVGEGFCDASFEILSNEHLAAEIARLEGMNGALDGAACGCCGRRYIDAPDEFVMDGRHQAKPEDGETMLRPSALRVIHKPCRGKPGARFTIAMEHDHQKRSADNARILQALVNGVGLNGIRRMLSPAGAKSSCGMSRVYDRIFWLERTLLAFEREQLRRWRERAAREGEKVRHHLAHDDIVLSVNWETRDDRRISQINCSTTADVRSGYVFRLDVDFDPTVDPATLFDWTFVDPERGLVNVRRDYESVSGEPYTAPLMSFQRPTGRFDEHHFFAAAASQVALFRSKDLPRMPADTPEQQREKAEVDAETAARLDLIRTLHHGYFDLPESTDDRRAPHTGIMTRDILTKAAHFEMLRRTLPPGWWTLVTEQEGMLPRILPHLFRAEIEADDLAWVAVTFDKEVTKPKVQERVEAFRRAYDRFIQGLRAADPVAEAAMTEGQRKRAFVAHAMATEVMWDRFGTASPMSTTNYSQRHMPKVWIRSPLQTSGETEKVVGFPLVRRTLRGHLKTLAFDEEITDPAMRERAARLVYAATLQPVSSFFNALRERVSLAQRAGGRAARFGPSYINGASYSPRVLIAVLNIFRVHHNWFEARPYVAPWTDTEETEEVEPGFATRRVPGSDRTVQVRKRRTKAPRKRTPAMRLGLQKEKRNEAGELAMPDIHRILYRPWLYAGTPVWDKFEQPGKDLRWNGASGRSSAPLKIAHARRTEVGTAPRGDVEAPAFNRSAPVGPSRQGA